jgi:PiT family inorganic phosphate transporter
MSSFALVLLVLAVFWLAYSNGANDNFKGVATLYGSSTTTYKRALLWSTITTAAGSLLSAFFANGLIKTFSGKGIVSEGLIGSPDLLISVAGSAAVTIFLATRLGLPTSSTHALTGTLVGVALADSGGGSFHNLINSLAAPLLFSPVIALALAAASYTAWRQCQRPSKFPGFCHLISLVKRADRKKAKTG